MSSTTRAGGGVLAATKRSFLGTWGVRHRTTRLRRVVWGRLASTRCSTTRTNGFSRRPSSKEASSNRCAEQVRTSVTFLVRWRLRGLLLPRFSAWEGTPPPAFGYCIGCTNKRVSIQWRGRGLRSSTSRCSLCQACTIKTSSTTRDANDGALTRDGRLIDGKMRAERRSLRGQNIARRRLVQRAMPLVARVAASSDGFRGHQREGFHADDDRRLLRGRQR